MQYCINHNASFTGNYITIVLFISFSHVGSAANSNDDTTAQVICNIIGYVWGIGRPLMNIVIIEASFTCNIW